MADIQMPQLGETVTEGTITKWFKQVGDAVAEDEPLFEVSTDKVDSEVPSPVSGTLSEILVAEGDTVDVGVVLARVGDAPAGEASATEAPAGEGDEQGAAETAAPEQGAPEEGGERAEATQDQGEAGSAPAPGETEADGAQGESSPAATDAPAEPEAPPAAAPAADGQAAAPAAPAAPDGQDAPASDGGRLLSPVVRRLISENNLDPAAITGTGPGGRITRNDVLSVLDQGGAAAAAAPAATAPRRHRRSRRRPRSRPPPRPGPRRRLPSRWHGPASATPRSPTPTSAGARPST